MRLLIRIGVVLSLLLLAAHFLRAGAVWLVIPLALAPLLLLVRRPWVPRLLQVVLLLGAVEWLRTVVVLVSARAEAGQPYSRMALILGAVVAVTALSALGLSRDRRDPELTR